MLTHIGQGDVLVRLNCGKPIGLTNKTFTLDCSAEYIECPNCKAKYDVQVYHARGSKILGKEAELIIDEANAYRGEEMTRDEAVEILKEISAINGTTRGTYAVALDMAIEALQAEPVLHCKDCKHWHNGVNITYCYKLSLAMIKGNDYCSFGER